MRKRYLLPSCTATLRLAAFLLTIVLFTGLAHAQTCSPGAIGANQTICNGGNPVPFTSSTDGTGDGTISYLWEQSVSPFTAWTTISGATDAAYDAPSLTATTRFRRTTVSSLDGATCTSNPSDYVTVTVQAVVTPGMFSRAQGFCRGGGDPVPFTNTTAGGGSGTISYQWQEANVSPYTSWADIGGANDITYDPPMVTVTTQFRRYTISTLNGVSCSAATTPIQVIVNVLRPFAGSIAGNQTFCSEGENPAGFTVATPGSGNGLVNYLWERATAPFTTWTAIAGVTSSVYDAPTLTETTRFRRITRVTVGVLICYSDPTDFITVTVEDPTPGSIGGSQTFCNGSGDPAAFTSTVDATGPGTISYIWEQAEAPFTTWTTIAGATSATYDAPALACRHVHPTYHLYQRHRWNP